MNAAQISRGIFGPPFGTSPPKEWREGVPHGDGWLRAAALEANLSITQTEQAPGHWDGVALDASLLPGTSQAEIDANRDTLKQAIAIAYRNWKSQIEQYLHR